MITINGAEPCHDKQILCNQYFDIDNLSPSFVMMALSIISNDDSRLSRFECLRRLFPLLDRQPKDIKHSSVAIIFPFRKEDTKKKLQ